MLETMVRFNTTCADALLTAIATDQPPFLLDVRTIRELEERGRITGAVSMPLQELTQNIDLLPDFDTPVVVYYGSGWRATIAMTALSAMGWTDFKALKYSFQEWIDADNALEEGPASKAIVLDVAEPDADALAALDVMINNIPEGYSVTTDEQFNADAVENPALKLIDVRSVEELKEDGVIDSGGAEQIHIPLESFISKKDKWPSDSAAGITVYCGSGHRSTIAMTVLWTYLYTQAQSLKGVFGNWLREGYPVVWYVAP
jgi:rhodanese-related sulfurtransferase